MRTEIEWTDDAWEHWGAVRDRNRMLTSYFGDRVGIDQDQGLLNSFAAVTFAAGPVQVHKDGEGFLIYTPHIVIGLIFTPDTAEQMARRLRAAGCPFDPDIGGPIHADWPRTGTWSAHS